MLNHLQCCSLAKSLVSRGCNHFIVKSAASINSTWQVYRNQKSPHAGPSLVQPPLIVIEWSDAAISALLMHECSEPSCWVKYPSEPLLARSSRQHRQQFLQNTTPTCWQLEHTGPKSQHESVCNPPTVYCKDWSIHVHTHFCNHACSLWQRLFVLHDMRNICSLMFSYLNFTRKPTRHCTKHVVQVDTGTVV